MERRIYEDQGYQQPPDPDESRKRSTRLITQPYDIVIGSLLGQIDNGTVFLRQISEKPRFQRKYVWTDRLASRLIESILLNVPIPPCYLAQDRDYKLDVIDGQQRIFSIYRFMRNQLRLRDLEVLDDLNGKYAFEIQAELLRKIETYTLRCVLVTNDSDPEIKYEVFERLNTSTMPLNAQELRNSISRGALVDLLGELATDSAWLNILHRKEPDRRMRGEELILRFFAFNVMGLEGYRTPQKQWLDEMADLGREFPADRIEKLASTWKSTVDKCLLVFTPDECFRRMPVIQHQVVNRALMDLTMFSLTNVPKTSIETQSTAYRNRVEEIVKNQEFDDLITRSIDHKSRTLRRFELWTEKVTFGLF